MDIALIAVSACLPTCLPACVVNVSEKSRNSSTKVVLGLSFCLLSLSVLEVLPAQWMMMVQQDENENIENEGKSENSHYIVTLSTAYRCLFCTLALFTLIVLPSLIAIQLFGYIRCFVGVPTPNSTRKTTDASSLMESPEAFKKRTFHRVPWRHQSHHWSIRFILGTLCLVTELFMQIARIIRSTGRFLCCRRRANQSSTLPLTNPLVRQKSFLLRWRLCNIFKCRSEHFYGACCGVAATLLILSTFAPRIIRITHDNSKQEYFVFSWLQPIWLLTTAVAWMCSVGLLLSAILNGVGSVSMPYSCLVGLSLKPIHPEAIAQAEAELRKANESIKLLRAQNDPATFMTVQSQPLNTRRNTSFADLGEEIQQRRKVLLSEITFLETLAKELTADIAEMRFSQHLAIAARSPMGRLRSCLGVIFSIILLIKLGSALISTWHASLEPLQPSNSADAVTRIVLWLIGHDYVSHTDYNVVSQLISLLLTAILSFSQVSTFLQALNAVSHRLQTVYRKIPCQKSQSKNSSQNAQSSENVFDQQRSGYSSKSSIYAHVVACFMACYFLACIVITKKMLPEKSRLGFSAAMGNNAFHVRSRAINLTFVLSALVSCTVLGLHLAIQRQNSHRHQIYQKPQSFDADVLEP